MKHCIQINIGARKFTFNVDIKREADLTAPLFDIINKYIMKDSKNVETLKEIENLIKKDLKSNSNLLSLLNKDVLTDSDVSNLLETYTGNSSVYNIAAYFNASRRSDRILQLCNLLSNGNLIDTSKYDILVLNGVKNKILTGNNRTLIVLNPESSVEETSSILSTVYVLDQLREPNSALFKQFSENINEYMGDLANEIKDLSMMDKAIYLFANPNLEEKIRKRLDDLINKDINAKLLIAQNLKMTGSQQENMLFDIMVDNRDEVIYSKDGTKHATIKDIINFKNGLWNSYTVKATEEEFKEAFGLEEVDTELYERSLWGYLIKNKDVADIVYEKLNDVKGKRVKDRLYEACKLLLVDNIKIPETDYTYTSDPSKLNIETGTVFNQNRMIRLRHSGFKENTLIISTKVNDVVGLGTSVTIPLKMALNEKASTSKIIKDNKLYNIMFEGIGLNDSEHLLNIYKDNIRYLTVKDGTKNDIEYVKRANAYGYQVNMYSNNSSDGLLDKYRPIMPISINPLAGKFKPLVAQKKMFSILNSGGKILVPVLATSTLLNQYSVGESFKLYNELNPEETAGVNIEYKIPLIHQYYQVSINQNIEPGDIVSLNGRKYVFVERNSESIAKCIDLKTNEITEVSLTALESVNDGTYKLITPINNNIIWYKDSNGKEQFYDTYNNNFTDKVTYFKNNLEEWSKLSGISVSELQNMLKDGKERTLFMLKHSDYSEKSVVYPSTNEFKYFTMRALVENLNKRLTRGNVKVVWFNSKSTKEELGIKSKFKIKDYVNVKAFTQNGIIYLNEDFCGIDSCVHELSHIILAALRISDESAYYSLLARIKDVPQEFQDLYKGLTWDDLKEEYLVHLFSSYFTNADQTVITDTMDDIDWDEAVRTVFDLSEDINKSEVMELMNKTIRDVLYNSNGDYSNLFSNTRITKKFYNLTKLSALKEILIKEDIIEENCK